MIASDVDAEMRGERVHAEELARVVANRQVSEIFSL